MKSITTVAAVACLLAVTGIAGADWVRTFQEAPYTAVAEGTAVDGIEGWWSSTGPNRMLDGAYGKPGRAVQFYPGTGAHFIVRWMAAGENETFLEYGFTGLKSNSGNNVYMGFTQANQGSSGNRVTFGIEGTNLVVYSDGQTFAGYANVFPNTATWYDARLLLDDGTGLMTVQYKENSSSTWLGSGTVGMPSGWGGVAQACNQIWVQADGSDGPFVDDLTLIVPEPMTLGLLAIGGLVALRRRRR